MKIKEEAFSYPVWEIAKYGPIMEIRNYNHRICEKKYGSWIYQWILRHDIKIQTTNRKRDKLDFTEYKYFGTRKNNIGNFLNVDIHDIVTKTLFFYFQIDLDFISFA